LPRKRWELYDHAASALLEHWDVNKHLRDHRLLNHGDFIGEGEKKELLQRLAYRMQSSEGGLAGNFIHRTELEAEFEQYLKDRFSKSPADAKAIARVLISQFRDRNFILCFRGAGSFGFMHRGFLEFFCASRFVHKFEKGKEITLQQLCQVYTDRWPDRSWDEVLRLICGMVDARFAAELIETLRRVSNQPQPGDYKKRKPWNLALAIQCFGELQNLDSVRETARHLLESLCSVFSAVRWGDFYSFATFLDTQIVPIAERIGSRWPHRDLLGVWLREQRYGFMYENESGREVADWELVQSIAQVVGFVGSASNEVHELVLSYASGHDETLVVFSFFALTSGWKSDPRTFSVVRGYLDKPTIYPSVREAAVQVLAEYFSDDGQTLLSLMDLAQKKDSSQWDRFQIVDAITKHCAQKSGVFEFLLDRAINDAHSPIRRTAVGALAKNYAGQSGVSELLFERASVDPDGGVRGAALNGLASYFASSEATLDVLQRRAVEDPESYTRGLALRAISDNFRYMPTTLALLRQRAVSDQDGHTRGVALAALAQNFRHLEGTYQLLRARVLTDSAASTRAVGLRELANNFWNTDGTFELICERAINDDSPSADSKKLGVTNVRGTAMDILTRKWPSHADTISLLWDRAEKDPTPWLREHARELATELEKLRAG